MSLPPVLSGKRRLRFGYLVANGIGQAGVAVGMAMLVKLGFDTLVTPGQAFSLETAATFGGGFMAVIAAAAWLRWRSHLDAEHLGQSYVHAVRLKLFRHLTRIGADGARQMSRGAVVLRFVGDLTALRQWISFGLARLTVSGLAAVLAVGMLSFIEPVVALAVAVAVIVAAALALGIGPRLRVTTRETRRRRGRLASMLNDRVSHIGVVEAFGQENKEHKRFERLSTKLRHSLIDRARVIGLLRSLSEASGSLASLCALIVGAVQVGAGHASPGAVVAAMVVAGFLAPRLQDLGRVYEYWNGALIAREKQLQLLALKPVGRRRRRGKTEALADGDGAIGLDDIELKGLFDGLSVSIAAGERIAIVGPNGAGKSTLLRLIAGILHADAGTVRLDGQDIAKCRWQDLRRAFALVSPDLPLLRGSLRLNLTYGGDRPSDEVLLRVLSDLGLDALVERLRHGLDARISEDGAGLSTGERARIALARAVLVRPRVLLLDEADANLDRTARAVLEQVTRAYDGTVLFVTHDANRAAAADRILRLANGKLTPITASELSPTSDTPAGPSGLRLVN